MSHPYVQLQRATSLTLIKAYAFNRIHGPIFNGVAHQGSVSRWRSSHQWRNNLVCGICDWQGFNLPLFQTFLWSFWDVILCVFVSRTHRLFTGVLRQQSASQSQGINSRRRQTITASYAVVWNRGRLHCPLSTNVGSPRLSLNIYI